jgi:hypothetical protein
MQKGFESAVEDLNNGSRITEAVLSLKKAAGVLGKKIRFQVADSETQPNSSIQAATRFMVEKSGLASAANPIERDVGAWLGYCPYAPARPPNLPQSMLAQADQVIKKERILHQKSVTLRPILNKPRGRRP